MRAPFACAIVVASTMAPARADKGKDEVRARKVAYDYAMCVVRKHHDKASEVILAMASNDSVNRELSQISDTGCLVDAAGYNVDMRFPDDTYKYGLADALVAADFGGRDGATSFADRLPLAQPSPVSVEQATEVLAKAKGARRRDKAQDLIMRLNALAWLSSYGECVVRKDPVNARYWLLTPADGPEETSRIAAMKPAFASCLDEGTMRFNRTTIRGTVAINYYRLAKATPMPAGGSEH